ncbi:MAG: M23 family metallopeptidase [Bacteroidota bacterium]|nr:M23 family metallopeptidase [Bacteroidota bacterium]
MSPKKKKHELSWWEQKDKWVDKLRNKYRLIILNETTFEEKLSFRLSRLNVFVVIGILAILLVFLTTYIIAFTPLKEYIPGYQSISAQKQLYAIQLRADSLEKEMHAKDLVLKNIQNIIGGGLPRDTINEKPSDSSTVKYKNIKTAPNEEEMALRNDFDKETRYNISPSKEKNASASSIRTINFFAPVKGTITTRFNVNDKHYGIDIAASKDEPVKAALEGTVIFADFTPKTGYVIGIQHRLNFITIYKQNSIILKNPGQFVRAGEPIAIVGNSREQNNGPHLHFELWHNGSPVNPLDYIDF